jgi:hypothetical protein
VTNIQPDTENRDSVVVVYCLILCLLFAIWLALNGNSMLVDPDTAWHIKVGEDIWRTGSFPVVDTYSHTFLGKPWIAKEWLGQIVLAGAYGVAQWQGVVAVSAGTIIALAAFMYFFATQFLSPPISAVLTILGMGAARSSFLARPHLFALPLTVAWSFLLFKDADQAKPPRFWLLVILVLWANLHASFTIGWVIAVMAFLHYCETTRLQDRQGLIRWIIFVALCPLVTMLHPYGYKAALMTFAVTTANEATPLLEEWLPFNPATQTASLAALLIWIGTSLLAGVRLSWSKAALCLGLTYLFLAHARFGSLLFTIAPVIMAKELARAQPAVSLASWKHRAMDGSEALLARHFMPFCAALGIGLIAIVAALATRMPAARPPELAITNAIRFAKEHDLKGPVMNFYNLGGALIQNGIPTFIDGRSDQLFQNGFFLNDQKTMHPDGGQAFADALSKYKITWTIFPPDDPRNTRLDSMPEWQRVYADDVAVIHSKVH